ncbi:nuclear RNA export factor 1-like [Orussus abietinus]|uniref:nuclear RNA export factor 1-like n=1 Tax=Orussus abietinus TaxID=222816 RepID=UPI000625B7B3|nr:nuclear RNA export factor 1-like [Orussus abietinus]
MPKKSSKPSWVGKGGRNDNLESKSYFGHDDRVVRMGGNRPRVSFKTQARPGRERPHNMNLALKRQLDDDVSMSIHPNDNGRQGGIRGRGIGLRRGRNSPLPPRGMGGQRAFHRRQLIPISESNWYKVIIPYGRKFDKMFLLNNLLSHMAPESFTPVMYKVIGSDAVFYVDDAKAAIRLANCDRKITVPDGFKILVRVKPGFPQCIIDTTLKERLKQAMAKRYVQETNALDLSRFHLDPDLVSDYFCALFRPMMLLAVLDIVSAHTPNLVALNLEGNKLEVIELLNVLNKKFPNLKILYIGDNRIEKINQLDVLKDLALEELRLAGNPVCDKYKSSQSDYVSDVRKRFPKLLRLDGVELPRPILFDVADDEIKLPPTQRMFVANPKAQEIASQFLQQYFLIYDSENRQPLLDAYHEHGCFSLTVNHTQNVNKDYSKYLTESRNLFRITDSGRRRKLLKQGRLPIVSFISTLPRTNHDLNSFTMDICLATERMMLITVTGLFQEIENKSQIRCFNRTFIIVPEGNGYCIRNEQLHISNPTGAQEVLIQNQPMMMEAQGSQSTATVESVASTMPSTSEETLSEETKRQMTLILSQRTNMTLEWSLKCLEEVRWNFNDAMAAFQEFFKRGEIPQEAFKK